MNQNPPNPYVSEAMKELAEQHAAAAELSRVSELQKNRQVLEAYAVAAMQALVSAHAAPTGQGFNKAIATMAWDLAEGMLEEREARRDRHDKRMQELVDRLARATTGGAG